MDTAGKVIYINTFSKTMVPALRISYMVLPASLMKLYKDAMGFYSCTVSSFEQYTLAQFISQGHLNSHINRLKRHYAGIRKKLVSAIGASPLNKISSIYEFDAGTHLLLTVHTELDDEAIRSAGVQKGLSLQLYSDYCSSEFTKRTGVLVINYATINPEKIVPFIARLCDVFPECRRDSQDNFDAAR